MIEPDIKYLEKCIKAGLIQSPCLELGVAYGGATNKDLIRHSGIEYAGTDLAPDVNVDYVIDFEDSADLVMQAVNQKKFGSILVFNVLEHTFDPITILDNVFNLLMPGGTCVIITPTVWPLHDFPYDCWRINPNFYEIYCKRRSLQLLEDYFEYVGFHNVKDNRNQNGTYVLPSASNSRFKSVKSKIVHKLFNTYGRGMVFPAHIATGVVIKK